MGFVSGNDGMNLLNTLIILVAMLGSEAYAWNLGVEADILHPLLRSAERTQVDRTWISPRFFFAEQFHIGAELIHDSGEVSGSASGTAIGETSAPSSFRGLSFGYYPSGYINNSFRISIAAGSAKRRFTDSLLGSSETRGTFYLVEAGYQFVGTLGLLGMSLAWMDSDLKEEASFSLAGNQSELKKSNSDVLLKVAVGVAF